MSHHYSKAKWFDIFYSELTKRLPRNWYVHFLPFSDKTKELVFAHRGDKKGIHAKKPIMWTTISPRLAADIFLNEFLKGRQ